MATGETTRRDVRETSHRALVTPQQWLPSENWVVGLSRFELLTPRLSSVCSNQLSYRPVLKPFSPLQLSKNRRAASIPSKLDRRARPNPPSARSISSVVRGRPPTDSRKEVIQPQVLLQLPCYDFTPITDHTLGTCPPCGLAGLLLVQPAFVM